MRWKSVSYTWFLSPALATAVSSSEFVFLGRWSRVLVFDAAVICAHVCDDRDPIKLVGTCDTRNVYRSQPWLLFALISREDRVLDVVIP